MKDNIKQALQVVLIVLGPLLLKHHISMDGGIIDDIAGVLSDVAGIWWKFHHWNSTPDQPAVGPTGASTPPMSLGGALHLLVLFALSLSLCVGFVVGCTTNQQKIAANSLYTLEVTTTGTVDMYDTLVFQGKLPTNDVPRVSHLYNDFQASWLLALDTVRYNTNAIAPPALVVESQDLVNLITTLKAKGTK